MRTIKGYTLEETLYDGSRTLVRRGRRDSDGERVVVKFLRSEYPGARDLARREREFEILGRITSNRVVRAIALETAGNGKALVLEDFGGVSLASVLAERQPEIYECLDIAIRIVEGIAAIHKHHIIHKDINPGNVIYASGTGELRIADFDIASMLSREQPEILHPRRLEGTLSFLSPEQTGRMNRAIDYRSDFYSLGVTLYVLLTGRRPFDTVDPLELVHSHIARTPLPPREVNPDVPAVLSDIVLRLLEKTPEARYQSAIGILHDLEKCRDLLRRDGMITPFPLGTLDVSERFQIPERLYGRDRETALLLESFDRIAKGSTELMLVSGISGIGKSALVHEIHKPIVERRGYFVVGKYNQFGRAQPYSAIIQCFQELVRQILTEDPDTIDAWREQLSRALLTLGQVVVDVIPEVADIIGPQPPVRELSPYESQNRFNAVFLKFVHVFMRADHPLVMFLDDLQWADTASLNLLHLLLTDPKSGYLFLIGAYRSTEVAAGHPLTAILARLEQQQAPIQSVELNAFEPAHVEELLSDTLRRPKGECAALASLVMRKTAGNPFFVNEFLKTLYTRGLVSFSTEEGGWVWDTDRIDKEAITENVVVLMSDRISSLGTDAQELLRVAACLGATFDLHTLSLVRPESVAVLAGMLWEPLQAGLILPIGDNLQLDAIAREGLHDISDVSPPEYRFLHDRVQQAAYSLIPEKERPATHLRIGRLLFQNMAPGKREERIFDIVMQMNLGATLLASDDERLDLARLNLEAGSKAKLASAYEPALRHFDEGIALLPEDPWENCYDLAYALNVGKFECEYMLLRFEQMELLFTYIVERVRKPIEKLPLYVVKLVVKSAASSYDEANAIGIEALQLMDITLPEHPTQEDIGAAFGRVMQKIGDRKPMDLLDLPLASDPVTHQLMRLLSDLIGPTYQGNLDLFAMVVLQMVERSLDYGNTVYCAHGYNLFGSMLAVMGNYDAAVQFGLMGNALSERYNDLSSISRTHLVFGMMLSHLHLPLTESLRFLRRAEEAGQDSGDFHPVIYAVAHAPMTMFLLGTPLGEMTVDVEHAYGYSAAAHYQDGIDMATSYRQSIRCLQGKTRSGDDLSDSEYDEAETITRLESNVGLLPLHWHLVCRLFICCFQGEYAAAVEAGQRALSMVALSSTFSHALGNYLYLPVALLLNWEKLTAEQQSEAETQIDVCLEKLNGFATENVEAIRSLIEAERLRIQGKILEAEDAYHNAIDHAHAREAIHIEALACERVARLYLKRKRPRVAEVFIRDAIYHYNRWGASHRASMLAREFPGAQAAHGSSETLTVVGPETETTNTVIGALDLASVMKATQAISGAIVLGDLLRRLMDIAIEAGGAQRGVFLLMRDGRMRVVAEARVGETTTLLLEQPADPTGVVSESVLQLVTRERDTLIVDDATEDMRFASDNFVQTHALKSILCMPIVQKGALSGILYLENSLTSGAFAAQRADLLALLSGQIAISLENAMLYSDLERKVEERTTELRQKNGELAVALDHLRKTQGHLIQAEKMASLAQLTDGIAHEIKNPLNFVNNFSMLSRELIGEILSSFEEYREKQVSEVSEKFGEMFTSLSGYALRIHEHGQRADRIVQNMLLHSQKGGRTITSVDINALLDDSLKLVSNALHSQYPDFEPTIERSFADGLPEVQGFPQDLMRVFINLMNNALYAMHEKGESEAAPGYSPTLNCMTALEGDAVIVRISDNGSGIPDDIKAKVLEPFFTTKPTGVGTGLGLSLSYETVVKGHGGRMHFDSTDGEGTVFTIALPK
ncbi:AAA family ATPase [bacterium]|nr:AAA family ATPase [bacterium]